MTTKNKPRWRNYLLPLLLSGCAGTSRQCSSSCAESYGSDWLVAQYGYDGKPINCYKLPATSIGNEPNSDGIYWEDPHGNLVHISGWYERVQVERAQWKEAARSLRVDVATCQGGGE